MRVAGATKSAFTVDDIAWEMGRHHAYGLLLLALGCKGYARAIDGGMYATASAGLLDTHQVFFNERNSGDDSTILGALNSW